MSQAPKKRKSARKQSTSTAEARQTTVQALLKDLGGSVYGDIDEGRFPSLTLASRSVRNIVYDKKLQQFVLGPTTVKKSSGNIKHIRPFTQLVWLAYFAKKLVDEKRTSTLRDVFYSAQAFNVEFQDQAESDELITDLEVLMAMAREGMNIYPEERSAIFGNMRIEYTVPGYEGKLADLSANPDGVMIGPALTTAEFRDTDAELVLAIEKGGLFTRFTEERVHQKYKAILINTAGQPPRSTRYLIRRLNQELGLPVGILCDADPWGAHIAMVIKSGSVQREEPIIVRDSSGRISIRSIGEFVDQCIADYGCFYDSYGNEVCGAIPFETLSVGENTKVGFHPMAAAIRHHNTGRLLRVSSASGREVVVTPNHSVFVLKDGKVQAAQTSSLTSNDLLVIERRASFSRRRPVEIDSVKELLALSKEMILPKLYVHVEDEKSKYHNRRKLTTFEPGRKRPKLNRHLHSSFVSCRNGRATDKLPARLWLTKEFARLLGYYISEGRVAKANGTPRAVELSFGLGEPDVVDDAEACIHAVFPRATVRRVVDDLGNGVTLRFGGTPTALLFLRLCGTGFARKRIPMILMSAREEHVLEFLKGCFGDGYITNSGGLIWKMKNPQLITDLAYLMSCNGILPSIGSDKISLIVSGSSEVQKLVSTVLHDNDRALIISHIASTRQSSYLMPKSFPILSSGLAGLKKEIYRHSKHNPDSKNLYRRICEVVQYGAEGGTNRERLAGVLEHLLACQQEPLDKASASAVTSLHELVSGDISFDPIVKIEETGQADEYVYDISVPGIERFIGGRSGILLHNSANAAHLRELTTPSSVWLGVWASVTGDEPVVMELEGLIRNERIEDVFSRYSMERRGAYAIPVPPGVNALSCTSGGYVGVMPVSALTRHPYHGDILEFRTPGGFNVKTTANHSIQVFNTETFKLEPREASSLVEGDLVAACFRVPNSQALNHLNLAQLIASECPQEADKVFVEGEDAKRFCEVVRRKYTKKELRERFYQVLKRDTPKLSYFMTEGLMPGEGFLRLRWSAHRIPLSIDVTPELGRLLGYHTAEGNARPGRRGGPCELTFGGGEEAYVRDAIQCANKVFQVTPVVKRRANRIDVRFGGRLLSTIFVKALKTGWHASNKQVPFVMFNAPNDVKKEFVRGCFRGDRMVNYEEGTRLSLKTVSRKLAADLTVLLRQLGCVSYVWKSGTANVVSCAEVGPIQDVADEICRKHVETPSEIRSMPGQLVYPLRNVMRNLTPSGKKSVLDRTLFTNGGKTRVGYSRLVQAFQIFEKPPQDQRLLTLMNLVQNDVVLLPIKNIRNLGKSNDPVFDLEVDGIHTFVGGVGGLILHNSDIQKYKLPSDKLTEVDVKRLYELKADPRYTEKMWHDELETFLKYRRKSEQEAFARYGLSYIVDKYLPEKLELMKSA